MFNRIGTIAAAVIAAVLLFSKQPEPQIVAAPLPLPVAPVIVGSPPGELAALRTANESLESELSELREQLKKQADSFPGHSPPHPAVAAVPPVSLQVASVATAGRECAGGNCQLSRNPLRLPAERPKVFQRQARRLLFWRR